MNHHEEPLQGGGTDSEVDERATAVPGRSIVAGTKVRPKPVGLWGVRAWVWEFRVPPEQAPDGF